MLRARTPAQQVDRLEQIKERVLLTLLAIRGMGGESVTQEHINALTAPLWDAIDRMTALASDICPELKEAANG